MPQLAACAAVAAATGLFFPALRVFLSNHLFFNVSLAHAAGWLALGATALALSLGAAGALLPARAREQYCAILLGASFFAWFKASFLAWDYGMFTGDPVPWGRYASEATYDAVALTVFAAASVLGARELAKRSQLLAAFLAAVQAAGLVAATPLARAVDREQILAKRTVEVLPRTAERVSERENVVLLIVDTLQSDVAADWLARAPAAKSLDGFRFFPDAAAEAGVTWLSVPAALTGVLYDNQSPYPAYLRSAFAGPTSALARLRSAGWEVELDPWGSSTPVPLSPSVVSNLREGGLSPALGALKSMALVGAFTILPQFAQQSLHERLLGEILEFLDPDTDNNLRFVRDIERLPVQRIDAPLVKLIHLRGPHVPLLRYGPHGFDYRSAAGAADAMPAVAPFTRENYERATEAMLEAVSRYLDKLKRAGGYERTAVFVFGDHGAGRLGQRFLVPALPAYDGGNAPISSGAQAAAAAALFVKPPGAEGAPVIVPDPVSLADIGATLNGDGSRLYGRPGAVRERSRRFLDLSSVRFDAQGRLPPLVEYRIEGPVWQDASWKPSGTRYLASGISRAAPQYRAGDTLRFGDRSAALPYVDYGWRVPLPDSDYLWSDGHVARLRLPLAEPARGGGTIELEMGPYADTRQAVVLVNGRRVAELAVDFRRRYEIAVPPQALPGRALELEFRLPDPASPRMARGEPDEGLLALQVHSFRFIAAK